MIKTFKFYVAAWAVLFVLYNIIVFVIPENILGISRSSASFILGYIFAVIAFICNLICSFIAFKSENAKKFFMHIPLIKYSWSALCLCCLINIIGMFIEAIPYWVVIIFNSLILGFYIISIISSEAAVDVVEVVEKHIEKKTSFLKKMIAASQALKDTADYELSEPLKNVYEELRYSDPMSSEELTDIENKLKVKFDELSEAVSKKDKSNVEAISVEFIGILKQRNALCKASK